MHRLQAFCILFFMFLLAGDILAQTQDEFTDKMTKVYTLTDEKEKAKVAKEMYDMLEKSKDLQTYSNYLMMKQIFDNQAPNTEYSKLCQEKADKLLAQMTGGASGTGSNKDDDFNSKWLNEYFPALFTTTDRQNAQKASKFVEQHPTLQTFSNYTYIGYAWERNGDFLKAKEYYEKALPLAGDDKATFNSYAYYTNFLSNTGEYLKAEEYIKRMQRLSTESVEYYRDSYKAESLTSTLVYYLGIGDYYSYISASEAQHEFFSRKFYNNQIKCDPFPSTRYTYIGFANELLRNYDASRTYYLKRDSSEYAWIQCHNKEYPNNKMNPLSMAPVYLIKIGKKQDITKPIDFYIKETETHYSAYSDYADINTSFMRAQQLGFLGAAQYHEQFKGIMKQIVDTKDFRSSTLPFSSYAYFTMRDRKLDLSSQTYDQLFTINQEWINDIIFTFGEKAFVTYYNSKLKEGYDSYHSFVKLAKENKSPLYPHLAAQDYNNILFTKSLSLKGTQKRKEAFLNSNDPTIRAMYEEWIAKKQELIRLYQSASSQPDQSNVVDKEKIKKLQEEVNHLENELTYKAKDFKKYLKITAPDWKTVRDQLGEGEAAVEIVRFQWRDQVYYSDSSYYAAYIITKNCTAPDVVYLPDFAKDMDGKYYKLYQNRIRSKAIDNDSYQHYWKPIQDHLKGVNRVYFSPDGIYHLINMPTLFNPGTGKYLLEEMDIQNLISTSDILISTNTAPVKTAVLFGRPTYFIQDTEETTAPIAMQADNTRSFVRGFRDNTIADLPGTEREVLTIQQEMNKHNIQVTLYAKDKATEDQLYKLKSPDILHIATHGFWSDPGPSATDGYRTFHAMVNSGLLMAGVVNFYSSAEYPDTYDGIMTAYEAQNLNLDNTSLVILSACETSLGTFDAGEGVYGLQRAFRAAGAQSVVTSLWKVDDEATGQFMILFYSEYLKTGDKHQAFHYAQKTLKEKFPHPYYWGAFVLTGK